MTATDCNHVCCDQRQDPFHSHAIALADCSPCRRERQRESEAAIARGAEMAEAFIAAGNSRGGAATGSPTVPAAPSGQPDPADQMAAATTEAIVGITIRGASPETIKIALAGAFRLALRNYR